MLFASSFLSVKSQVKEKDYRKMKYTQNLLFVQGNKDVEPFFISTKPILNREYITYLRWLEQVYVDYPSVLENAFPGELRKPLDYKTYDLNYEFRLNELIRSSEEFIKNYVFNPDYLDYPVIGLSWEQANDFCFWLTDRYNKYVLIKEDILFFSTDQLDEENFVTETYLANQFEALVHKGFKDKTTGDIRNVNWEDGILFPAFRLPTKAEFELVTAASDLSGDIYISGSIRYEIGKNNFIWPWWNIYCSVSDKGLVLHNYHNNVVVEKPSDYEELKWPEKVLEWCLDSKISEEGLSPNEIYKAYGAQVKPYRDILEKVISDTPEIRRDSLGRMPYRIISADEDGAKIVEFSRGNTFPDTPNYLYDPATNTVVSNHYDRIFTCFRYVVPAIKKCD